MTYFVIFRSPFHFRVKYILNCTGKPFSVFSFQPIRRERSDDDVRNNIYNNIVFTPNGLPTTWLLYIIISAITTYCIVVIAVIIIITTDISIISIVIVIQNERNHLLLLQMPAEVNWDKAGFRKSMDAYPANVYILLL